MNRTSDELLREALVHLELATQYAAAAEFNQLVVDAICMRLSAGIEVLARLDPDVRTTLFGSDWRLMWGMRNRIAHGYMLVNVDIVTETAQRDLPEILRNVRQALKLS